MVVIVHGSQDHNATATVLWDNAFAEPVSPCGTPNSTPHAPGVSLGRPQVPGPLLGGPLPTPGPQQSWGGGKGRSCELAARGMSSGSIWVPGLGTRTFLGL